MRRLVPFIETEDILPNEQHGFRPYRSCFSACRVLLNEIDSVNSKPGAALSAVFVDFKAAFDTGSRELAILLLAQAGLASKMLRIIATMLRPNRMKIDDGVTIGGEIEQTTGFAQGDNLSPLLFTVLIADLPHRIMSAEQDCEDTALR